MIRRRVMASVTAAAIAFGGAFQPRPAHAIFGVGDIVFNPAIYAEIVNEVKNGLAQIKWLTDIYGQANQQVRQLLAFYNLFAHVTDASQLVSILNSEFLHSPMLADALQLEQAFRGLGLTTSLAGKISAIAGRIRYYEPVANDFAARALNNSALATAGQMASAQDMYASATARARALKELQAGIVTDDPRRVTDITARATIEAGIAVAQSNQMAAAMMLQQAQRDAEQQQREQAWRYSVDQLQAQARAAANVR